ncbi:MAG: hypothetical protein LAT65_20035 [Saccharospirillum sp.]|nr:hypothetical protein [Saccharospirillum sp.]
MTVKHLSPENMNQRRKHAVELRLAGQTLAQVKQATGLSAPTVIKAFKAFEAGGWQAINLNKRGRKKGQGTELTTAHQQALKDWMLSDQGQQFWSRDTLASVIADQHGIQASERAIARLLETWGLTLPELAVKRPKGVRNAAAQWYRYQYQPLQEWAVQHKAEPLLGTCRAIPTWPGIYQLGIQTPQRKQLSWLSNQWPTEHWLIQACSALQQQHGTVALCLAGLDLRRATTLNTWLEANTTTIRLIEWRQEY